MRFLNDFKMLDQKLPIFFTSFQQKLLKTALALLLTIPLFSCAHLIRDSASFPVREGMSEEEVLRILGEPDTVSRMSDGTLLWVYRPSWKLIPDKRGMKVIEFREGKVSKVVRDK